MAWLKYLAFCLVVFLQISSHGELYKYTELMFKSYEDLNKHINKQFSDGNINLDAYTDSEDEQDVEQSKVNALREGLRYILSRPDKDGKNQDLMQKVRIPLERLKIYDETLFGVASEAISTFKNKDLSAEHRATALFMLENVMAEVRPQYNERPYFKRILEAIKSADLEVPKKVRQFRKNRGLFKSRNPSDLAEAILKPKDD